jgi:hypothetical protein
MKKHALRAALLCLVFSQIVTIKFMFTAVGSNSLGRPADEPLVISSYSSQQPKLRFEWTSLELHSNLAKRMHAHQHNCSVPVTPHMFRSSFGHQGPGFSRNYGLGSELHVWGHAALYAMLRGARVRSPHRLDWAWWDQETCNGTSSSSLLACYFPNAETSNCPNEIFDDDASKRSHLSLCGNQLGEQSSVADERVALTEYLFANVSPLVVDEATKQLKAVFPNGIVPPNLITIHVRWGDKDQEMKLKSIEEYIDATKRVVEEQQIDSVNIFLCTEDPKATAAFLSQVPKEWNVYLDYFYTYMLPYRSVNSTYNALGDLSMDILKGKAGLWALGSLLVAMEANIFILTTKSNWSRMMNELRQGIVNPRCNNCTTMIDIGFGEC